MSGAENGEHTVRAVRVAVGLASGVLLEPVTDRRRAFAIVIANACFPLQRLSLAFSL